MKVVGTAGHIDHGKSALVRALTGIEPDRLEEERRRGMTIDLGFAWLTLPSGEKVSIVDVPGHERFVKNMLAGAGGIDAALLVVAADESVMPQTREHLDILDLLDVRTGVVALTKCDLVEAELIDLVAAETGELLAGTTLEGSPIVPVSSHTGDGIPDLLTALDEAVAASRARANIGMAFLPVDRAFTIAGFGTVVTGTLRDGEIEVGSELEIQPGGVRVRVRGLQVHERPVDSAQPGDRVAVNLAGIERSRIRRGDVVAAPGSVSGVSRFEAVLRVVRGAPFAFPRQARVTLHVGAAERSATVSLIDAVQLAPGEGGYATIRVEQPVVAVAGLPFIIRLPAPARTVAGGTVLHTGPPLRGGRQRAGALHGLGSATLDDRLAAWLAVRRFGTAACAAGELRVRSDDAEEALRRALATGRAVDTGSGYMPTEGWTALSTRAVEIVSAFHRERPLDRGMPKEELRGRLHIPPQRWPGIVGRLVAEGVLRDGGNTVSEIGHVGGVGSRVAEADRVQALLREYGLAPPGVEELAREAGTDPGLVKALADEHEIVHVGGGLYFARDVVECFCREVLSMIDERGAVSAAEVRDRVGTSRRFVLALLEYLDDRRITRRSGDVRVRGSKAAACV